MKKKIKQRVESGVVSFLGKLLYLTGLTLIIPFFPLIFAPDRLVLLMVKSGTLLVGALLVLSGAVIVLDFYKARRGLRALGTFTLIPSFVALFYAIVGPELVSDIIGWAGPASVFVNRWIEFNMPRAITVAATYFLIGFALFLSSYLWQKESSS